MISCGTKRQRVSNVDLPNCIRTRRCAKASDPSTRRVSISKRARSCRWAILGLLPHRPGFHQLGEAQRHPGGSRARLRRGIAGCVFAARHRHRSHPLPSALRAVPQSRARLDAGLRHRLLPGRARSGDRLRQAQIRCRIRFADRDVRHACRQGCGARCRPRAGLAVYVRRWHRETDSVSAGQDRHAQEARRRAGIQRDLRA